MPYTRFQIESIDKQKKAVLHQSYLDERGLMWIGMPGGGLAIKATRDSDFNDLSKTNQVEIDFGNIAVSDALFFVTDTNIKPSSFIVAQMSYDAATDKDEDETEMDYLQIRCKAGDGFFTMFVNSSDGSYLHDKFKINYNS